MKISRKRVPVAFAAALATALVALPATAAADDKGAVYYGYENGPAVDGNFADWGDIPEIGTTQNAAAEQGKIRAHYNCSTGRLTLGVYGLHSAPPPTVPVETLTALGDPAPRNYVKVLDDKKNELGTYSRYNSNYAAGPGGYEISFNLAPGKYTLGYHAEGVAPDVTSSDVAPIGSVIGGYADIYIHCPILKPEKSAEGRYSHLYDWSVKKTATVGKKNSKAPTVNYRIDVTKSGPRTIDRDVVGTIKVHNPYRVGIPRVLIGDKGVYGVRSECKITSAKLYDPKTKDEKAYPVRRDASYVPFKIIPAGYTAYVGYICHPHPEIPVSKLPKKPENVGYVSHPHPNGKIPVPNGENGEQQVTAQGGGERPRIHTEYVKAPFTFSKLNQSYFTNVKVYDIFGGNKKKLGQLNASGTYSYQRKLTPPKEGCKVFKNTAKLVNHGAPQWGPSSTAYVKICRSKDGSVSTHAKNPKKADTDNNHGPKVCYVNLRTKVNGPRAINRRGAWFRATVRNRGRLAAGYVKTKISVSKGLKIVGVRGVPRKAVKIRGRHLYVAQKWIPKGKARSLRVRVAPKRNARVRVGYVKMVSKHRCDIDRSAKKFRVINRPPNNNNGDGGNGPTPE